MATPVKSLLRQVRNNLVDNRPVKSRFWQDDELLDHLTNGAKDLWGAILDTYGDHYLSIDTDHVSLEDGAEQLHGVPDDVFRVHLIEPRDTTTNGLTANVMFVPKKYNSRDFGVARSLSAIEPSSAGVIFYDVSGVGAPNGAPTILTAPKISGQLLIRLVYNKTLEPLREDDVNPIAGESDKALIAYATAFARSKEREDRQPDAGWLAVYSTEKQSVKAQITPRQDQEPEVVEGLFEDSYY